MDMFTAFVTAIWILCSFSQDAHAIVIVHHFEDSEATVSSVKSLTVNIPRQIVANEVEHALDSVTDDISNLKGRNEELARQLLRQGNSVDNLYLHMQKSKDDNDAILDVLSDRMFQMTSQVSKLKSGLLKLYKEILEGEVNKQPDKGAPQWYRKHRRSRILQKLDTFSKELGDINRAFDNIDGLSNFCENFSEKQNELPQSVRELLTKRHLKECWEYNMPEEELSGIPVEFRSYQHGYEDEAVGLDTEEVDDHGEQTQSNVSKKSNKRKIDEVFLKLMIRSQKMAWSDLNLIKENLALFMEHVTESTKLCSLVIIHPDRKHFEACKERVGMNFTMSLLVSLTTTVTLVVSVFLSALTIFKLREKVIALKNSSQKFSIKHVWAKLNLTKASGFIQGFTTTHAPAHPDLCVLVYGESDMEQCKVLLDRVLLSSEPPLTIMYHPLSSPSDLQQLQKPKAFLLLADVTSLRGGRLFEEEAGQHNVLFKVCAELAAQEEHPFFVTTNDPDSRQLPKGSLYNKTLVANNDNYILRSYCRGQRCVTCHTQFTPSQTTHLQNWIGGVMERP